MSMPYLYDEIPSPMSQSRFRGSLQNAQEKVQTYRNKNSSYSLNSTLPVRRSKSVDRFSEDTDSYDEQNVMMTSTHSVNIVPTGALRYGNNKKKPIVPQQQQQRVPNSHSVYSVLYPPDRPVRYVHRPASTRSLNLNNGDMAGYMKHTAV